MIQLLIISALFIYGWQYVTSYDASDIENDETADPPINPYGRSANNRQVLWFIRFYIGNFIWQFPNLRIILKPLFNCTYCMSSIYGTLFYWGYHLVNGLNPEALLVTTLIWPVFCICLCGLIRLIERITLN